jgi:hypothetical protein
MGRRYSIDGQANNDADDTILALISATTIKPKIYDLIVGSDATPADNAASYHLQRFSAAGTSTAVTPRPLDPDDPAALASAGENHTVEPTYTANLVLLNFSLNQRATFRWVAAPGGEIILPATANNGVGLRTIVSSSPVNTTCVMHYEE